MAWSQNKKLSESCSSCVSLKGFCLDSMTTVSHPHWSILHSDMFASLKWDKPFIDTRLHRGIAMPQRAASVYHHPGHYGQTWRHPWNQKYIMCCNAIRGGLSHNHSGSAQQISWRLVQRFQRYARRQTDTRTDRNTPLLYWGWVIRLVLTEVCVLWIDVGVLEEPVNIAGRCHGQQSMYSMQRTPVHCERALLRPPVRMMSSSLCASVSTCPVIMTTHRCTSTALL